MRKLVLLALCAALIPTACGDDKKRPTLNYTCPPKLVTPGSSLEVLFTVTNWSGGTPKDGDVQLLLLKHDSGTVRVPAPGATVKWTNDWRNCRDGTTRCIERTATLTFSPTFSEARFSGTTAFDKSNRFSCPLAAAKPPADGAGPTPTDGGADGPSKGDGPGTDGPSKRDGPAVDAPSGSCSQDGEPCSPSKKCCGKLFCGGGKCTVG